MGRFVLITCLFFFFLSPPSLSMTREGRIGVGFSNQLTGDFSALSLKLQHTKAFATSTLLGLSTRDDEGGHGIGLKFHQLFLLEPRLNVYGALLTAWNYQEVPGRNESGIQLEFTLGTEFSFEGLNSLGFSCEVGISLFDQNGFVMEITGRDFLSAGIHFYL